MTRISRNWLVPVLMSFALASFAITLPSPGFATGGEEEAGEGKEGKTSHFEVPLPKTTAEAVTLLKTNMGKIETALGAADFSAIHEATYSVESAVARIAQDPGYEGLKTTIAPRVEIVHLASEQGDAETLKAAVPILSKAVKEQLQALMK
jgi:hypothetical protein